MTKKDVLAAAMDGEGCLGKSQDDEPVFVLCGRDVFAADRVRDWADLVEQYGARTGGLTAARQAKVAEARRIALAMDHWRANTGAARVPE